MGIEILNQIIEEKRKEVEEAKRGIPEVELLEKMEGLPPRRSFKQSIGKSHEIHLIAEIKRSSPSKGIIRKDFDVVGIALDYKANGASALSILTDEKFFGGSLRHIETVRERVNLPILRKDFIIDEYQIYESAYWGSDALLLIASILSEEEMAGFGAIASRLGMDVLVEVHSEEDLEKALNTNLQIIGINNRDLRTFEVNLETTSRLIRIIPRDKVIVSESGIKTHKDVMFFKSLGVNAVLIGEVFMASQDIGAKVREIMGR